MDVNFPSWKAELRLFSVIGLGAHTCPGKPGVCSPSIGACPAHTPEIHVCMQGTHTPNPAPTCRAHNPCSYTSKPGKCCRSVAPHLSQVHSAGQQPSTHEFGGAPDTWRQFRDGSRRVTLAVLWDPSAHLGGVHLALGFGAYWHLRMSNFSKHYVLSFICLGPQSSIDTVDPPDHVQERLCVSSLNSPWDYRLFTCKCIKRAKDSVLKWIMPTVTMAPLQKVVSTNRLTCLYTVSFCGEIGSLQQRTISSFPESPRLRQYSNARA